MRATSRAFRAWESTELRAHPVYTRDRYPCRPRAAVARVQRVPRHPLNEAACARSTQGPRRRARSRAPTLHALERSEGRDCYLRGMKIVLSNVPPDKADGIATALVEERLAACVNLLPVRSVYRWQGAVQHDAEVTLLIKVAADRVQALRERIRALHPYELPEVLVVDVDLERSLPEYVEWVRAESKD